MTALLPPLPESVSEELVELGEEVILRVLRAGSGTPLVMLPGWTCTADFFVHQLADFADRGFEVIAVDPRGQGGSTKPLTGNTFAQRGLDLDALLNALGIREAVLFGWSFGVFDVLSYVRQFGTDRVSKLVLVDETPKAPALPGTEEWGEAELTHEGLVAFLRAMIDDRVGFWTGYAAYMIGRDDAALDDPDIARIVELGLQTPEHVALSTGADGLTSDYAQVAADASEQVPTLFIARDDWAEAAAHWVTVNLPDAEFATMPVHLGFATDPAEFDRTVAEFLERDE
ncbi:alpha/beta fold hydrolase [Agromyces larvae]|uniref:Alpha/beta hydrolase n=1 Tax=Agromyces larvae TaxID=2929802 RepID=A0ABY4C2B9_9MICO|nr:alpha/beta hydrolase [Agromyces larvae]UOE42925.1 alpha/beta hydrolase [Agromyces larvae]